MSVKTDVVEREITNRVRWAMRWHRLTDNKEIAQFVFDGPKIQAIINDEDFSQELMPLVLTKLVDLVVEANQAEDREQRLAELRQTHSDELVKLLAELVNEQD
jgi:hypothetical protein